MKIVRNKRSVYKYNLSREFASKPLICVYNIYWQIYTANLAIIERLESLSNAFSLVFWVWNATLRWTATQISVVTCNPYSGVSMETGTARYPVQQNCLFFHGIFSVKCHFKVDSYTEQCCNPDCPAGSGVSMETGTDTQYNIIISVSDHTGTLNNCRLNQDVAEQIVGCKVSKPAIKWSKT